MTAKVKDRPKARAAYEADLYSWVQEQVALLRSGQLDEIDAQNIAEELRDVGNSEYAQLESALRVLIMHMLKWDQQPEFRTRSWVFTIAEQRDRYHVVLGKNPGLKPHLDTMRSHVYRSARRWAANETNLHESEFPKTCPYDWDDLLDRPFEADSAPAPR